MMNLTIDPVHWSTRTLIAQGADIIQELARASVGTQTSYSVVLGRCLLAMDESKLCAELGFSSSIHYAIQRLGISRTEAYDARRVALALESLPLLTEEAELGRIAWSKLVNITKKASIETEEFWLRIAARKSCREIEKLCAASEYAGLPWEEGQEPELPVTKLQLHLDAERGELFEKVALSISERVGRTLSLAEALEHMAVEELSRRPATPRRIKNMREEARRSANARRRSNALLIQDARELAEEWGLSEITDSLAAALGFTPLGEDVRPSDSYSVQTSRQQCDERICPARLVPESGHGEPNVVQEDLQSRRDRGDVTPAGQADEITAEEADVISAGQADEITAEEADVTLAVRADVEKGTHPTRLECDAVQTSGRFCGARGTEHSVYGSTEPSGAACLQQESETVGTSVRAERGRGVEQGDALPGAGSQAESAAKLETGSVSGPSGGEPPALSCQPPCEISDLELVEIGSTRFDELVAAGYLDQKWDWQNPRLLFNPRARKATVAQRREILRRDGYCCRTPGCPHRMWLQLHHTVFFSRSGKTVRANLVPLCFRCHRNVHEGLLKITGNADGTLTFTDAYGQDLEQVHALGVAEWLNFWIGWKGGECDRHQPRAG